MKIKILGTAAAEGWPALFCECPSCQKARRLGGKNIRSRSSVLIDEKYKIDFPPDTYYHFTKFNISFSKIEYLFITHSHYDHFNFIDFLMRRFPPFSLTPLPLLNIYGNKKGKELLFSIMGRINKGFIENLDKYSLQYHVIEPFKRFKAGELEVIPLLAHHDPEQTCYNYIFTNTSLSFLQAFDTGWYLDRTWEALKEIASHNPFNLVIMDCTNGRVKAGKKGGHLGIDEIIEAKNKLQQQGSLAQGCHFIATHFSHGGGLLHDGLERILSKEGIDVAFDGMEIFLPDPKDQREAV